MSCVAGYFTALISGWFWAEDGGENKGTGPPDALFAGGSKRDFVSDCIVFLSPVL